VPVFLKRQVLVKVWPAGKRVSSGMVTSSIKTAWLVQSGKAVGRAVEEEALVAAEVGGVRVGKEKSDFVGGRVEVTKRGAEVGDSPPEEMETQEVKRSVHDRSKVQVFFMPGLYCKLHG